MFEVLNRSLLHVSGKDSFKLLQGLITNDLSLLKADEPNKVIYTFFLNALGRYLFDFFIVSFNDGYLIDIAPEQKNAFISKFNLYKMTSSAALEDVTDSYQVLYQTEKTIAYGEPCVIYVDPRHPELGFRAIYRALQTQAKSLSCAGLYFVDKYRYAIVDGHIDMVQDKSFPLEYGAESLNSLSFTKGCYLGQEVVSRTKYQGVVRKFIAKIKLGNSIMLPPAKGDAIHLADGTACGILCSWYADDAIALLRKEEYEKGRSAVGQSAVGQSTMGGNLASFFLNGQPLENVAVAPWLLTEI